MTYFVDERQLRILQGVLAKLYGDGRTLTADARRDCANTLHTVLLQVAAQVLPEQEK